MKIAIDVRDADGEKTGKGFFTYGLVKAILAQDPYNQYVLYSDKAKSPFPEQENVEFRHINQKGFKWHLDTLKDLKKVRPDLYLAPTSYIIPSLAPRWLKIVLVVHDLVAFLFPANHSKKAVFIERMTLRSALRKASKVFVVSENTQNDLIKIFHYPKSQTAEIPCAPHDRYFEEIDNKEAEKIRKKFSLPEQFILAVGTIEPRKNFANLIKSFVLVKRKFPEHKLVIVGKKGWKYQEIEKTIKQYQLEGDVIFPGYMKDEDLHNIYHLAQVFVFPSLYEGFGIPPLEAMASGCPVIASNNSSLPEVVGDAGLLIDPRNSVKIADAIISLIEKPQLREMLQDRGVQRCRKFTWDDSAQKALEEFQKLIGDNPLKTNESESPEKDQENQ
ncbi:glycosyltransferase family 4 protein [Candidatus Peregrinibacteria bacterium]|nr:glycosyltransferase family 4 protein [Candidatus Peregrinibacteria bacterium]